MNCDLLDDPVSVNTLQCEDNHSWKQPLPKRRIPIVDAVHEQKEIKQDRSCPVQDLERNETSSWSQGLDAADPHGGKYHEHQEPSDGGEEIHHDAIPKAGVDGVQTKGAEVSDEVDSGPEEQATGDGHVKQHWILQGKYLHKMQENATYLGGQV